MVVPGQPRIDGAGLDFRHEIMAQIFDKGDLRPRRTLAFRIEVTDEGSTHGSALAQTVVFKDWRHVEAIISTMR